MPVQSVTTLGGPASHIKVGKVGHGLLGMTLTHSPKPDEVAFAAIKAGVDSMPPGVKMLLNSAEFYAQDLGTGNLEMLARFFDKHPGYADKTVLAVKGGAKPNNLAPDASPENLRRSVTTVNAALRGTKRVDIFQCARVDPAHAIEETVGVLKGFVEEGLFDYVGLSECSAATIRKAHAVHPIVAVEIEVSPWSMEEETKNVLATARELDIAVMAYSPLGRGFLTGEIRSIDDLPANDNRRRFTRYRDPEAFKANLTLVDALKAIAEKKGTTAAELCIAFVASLGPKVIPIPGSTNEKRTVQNTYAADTELTQGELDEIWGIINSFEVKGDRYFGTDPRAVWLWG